jgi:hypothetical protein
MKQPESYINFEVYKDSKMFCGVTKATLPNVQFIQQTVSGAGIGGNVETILPGMTEAMSLTLNFRTVTDNAIDLCQPKLHNIDLRIAEQIGDTVNGTKNIICDKYVMSVMPKQTSLGNVAPASPADASGEYSVQVFKGYKAGKLVFDIEPYNYKCIINGTDYLAAVRKALGR